ncbi:MAG: alpha/beta fold hydrolase [Oscillospiraceae bacterium]|nr:alpha/beta fold hydrolase [Oscillospiraceae bacterium]
MEKKLMLKSEKYDIPAIFTLPENARKVPCVVMCHGTGSSKDEAGNQYADLAQLLAERGIASIRFDFAGCGESTDTGINQTFMAEVDDTRIAWEYVCSQPQVDSERNGIIGYSQGGRVMAMFLDTHYDRIKAAVSWYGACHNGEGAFAGWYDIFYPQAVENGYASIPLGWRSDLIVPLAWFEEIRNTNPLDALKKYKGELLVMAGDADVLVPMPHCEEIAATNEKAELIIYHDADHNFNVMTDDKSISQDMLITTADWFKEKL